jgi:hypothetical protein
VRASMAEHDALWARYLELDRELADQADRAHSCVRQEQGRRRAQVSATLCCHSFLNARRNVRLVG